MTNVSSTGIRVRELRLLGASGSERQYGAGFRTGAGSWRPLSIIAGPSLTGKTSIADFVRYCLGDDEFPLHPEVAASVRAAQLEVELAGEVTTIERATTGRASSFASIWRSDLEGLRDAEEVRIPTEPPSEPLGLSQRVLAACDLDNVHLPVAPIGSESDTQILSVRDLFRILWLPNDRLDNKNLVFEQSHFMVRQKFLQTIDVMFGVHDAAGADLASRAKAAGEASRVAERDAAMLRALAEDEYPAGPLVLETDLADAESQLMGLERRIRENDRLERSSQSSVRQLRGQLEAAQSRSQKAAIRVKNRESLLERLSALRGQYADDKKKLVFLSEAERLFDPLQVVVCPACLGRLKVAPHVTTTGHCSLCGSAVRDLDHRSDNGAVAGGSDAELGREVAGSDGTDGAAVLKAELRAVDRRLKELTEYWGRLDRDLRVLRREAFNAVEAEENAATAIDNLVELPAPFMAARDELSRIREDVTLRVQSLNSGLRLWHRAESAELEAERLAAHAAALRVERGRAKQRPDRTAVVSALSSRFGKVLAEIGYPKLERPHLDDGLIPYVRGLPYTSASSGGMVLISLAWYLSLWEVAHERGAAAPGLLIVDSPQKNLGHRASADDQEFADDRLVENFYGHVKAWLASDGVGAQMIVIDNSPPESLAEDVVIRFTRDRNRPPYGLITDAVD